MNYEITTGGRCIVYPQGEDGDGEAIELVDGSIIVEGHPVIVSDGPVSVEVKAVDQLVEDSTEGGEA